MLIAEPSPEIVKRGSSREIIPRDHRQRSSRGNPEISKERSRRWAEELSAELAAEEPTAELTAGELMAAETADEKTAELEAEELTAMKAAVVELTAA